MRLLSPQHKKDKKRKFENKTLESTSSVKGATSQNNVRKHYWLPDVGFQLQPTSAIRFEAFVRI